MNTDKYSDDEWLYEIKPKDNFFSLHLKEVWKYRDLLFLFVKRDVVDMQIKSGV
jgi:lipopolysaccharide transport system permease protein